VRTLRVIKEPIHDYIAISDLENNLINDPLFLRLQNISQNGLAYLTYPSNRTSRFVHSLGTMHVGGEMIRSALQTSDRGLRTQFLRAFKVVMEEAAANLSTRIDQIAKIVAKQNDIFYLHMGFDPQMRRDLPAIVVLQALRIACVMHDLGHPPFSHTVESVLQSKIDSLKWESAPEGYRHFGKILSDLRPAEDGQLHEKVGRELTSFVFTEVAGDYALFGKFCFSIANRIAIPESTSKNPNGILDCLHSIVSGESVDADRCDYVLRDGYASSFEFGEYDLTRILHNLRLHKTTKGAFEMVSTTTAVSALESFFLERYRIWRWIVFHPNVVKAEIALSRALAFLLEIAFADRLYDAQERVVRRILEKWNFSIFWRAFISPKHYREYLRCDEPWLLALLRDIQLNKDLSGWSSRRIAMLKIYLDFILDRRKPSIATLWKRAEEYDLFTGTVSKLAGPYQNKLLLTGLAQGQKGATEWFNQLLQAVLREDIEEGQVECMRKLEALLQKELLHVDGIEGSLLIKVLKFKPYKECFLVDKEGSKKPLSTISTVVANLNATWEKDIQLRIYWVSMRRRGKKYSLNMDSPTVPSGNQIATHFLPVLLGSNEWISLTQMVDSARNPHAKNG
jgi:HD superfamily phosphohydrolase